MTGITSVTTHFLADLPEEVSYNILSNLDPHTLCIFCRVSQNANRLASDDRLWQEYATGKDAPFTGIKAYVCRHAVGSFKQLVQRVQAFADQIQWKQKARLSIHFSSHPNYFIDYGIDSGDLPRNLAEYSIAKVFNADTHFRTTILYMQTVETEAELFTKFRGYPGQTYVGVLGIGNEKMIKDLTEIIMKRLEHLRTSREPQAVQKEGSRLIYPVGAVALSVIVALGIYWMRRR